MKKINFFKRVVWLLMPLLTLFNVSAWGKTVTYTITSTSAVSTSGTAPAGSSATFAASYSDKNQMTSGNTQTLTLSNYGIVAITNLTLSMRSNGSSGKGSLYYSTDGGTTKTYVIGSSSSGVKFNSSDWYGAWSTSYVDVSIDISFLTENAKNVVFGITSYENSIYCASYTITYVDEKYTVSYDGGTGTRDKASDTQTTVGQKITLPGATPPSDCEAKGWEFAGWKKGSAQTVTTEDPDLYAEGDKYTPDANVTMYAVYSLSEERTGCTAGKVNATGDLAVGDCVILYYESGTVQYNGLDGNTYGTQTSYTTTPASTHILEVREGKSSGQLSFYDKTDKNYLALNSDGNALHTLESVTNNSSWTVSISSGTATITNVAYTSRVLKYNSGATRFACYTSGQNLINLYKVCPPIVTYNSNPDCTYDYFVDIMHDNETIEKQGTYSAPAALSDATPGEDYCDEKHYHFLGWIEEQYVDEDGTLKDASKLKAPGASITADNKTFYAIWAKIE